jgi:hypothetical protein
MSELENYSVWKKVESFVRKNRNYIGGGFIVLLILLVLIILVSPKGTVSPKDTKTVSGSTETAVSGPSGPFTQKALKFIKDDKTLPYASTNPWCADVSYTFTVSGSGVTPTVIKTEKSYSNTYPMINLKYDDGSSLASSDKVVVKKTIGTNPPTTFEISMGDTKSSDTKYEITSDSVFVDYDNPCENKSELETPLVDKFVEYQPSTTRRSSSNKYEYTISYISTDPNVIGNKLVGPSAILPVDPYKMVDNDPVLIIKKSPYMSIIDKNKIMVSEIINGKSLPVNPSRITIDNLKIIIKGSPSVSDDITNKYENPKLTLVESIPIQVGEVKCVSNVVDYFANHINGTNIGRESDPIKFSYKLGDISKNPPVPLSSNGYYPKIKISSPYAIDLNTLQFRESLKDSTGIMKTHIISKDRLELVGDTVTIKNCPNQPIIAKSLKATNDGFKTSLVL